MPNTKLYESLTAQASSPEAVRAQLELLVSQYPYFIPARYFLLSNTPQSSAKYASLAAQTATHFSSGYRLQHRLMTGTLAQTSNSVITDISVNDEEITNAPNAELLHAAHENSVEDAEIEVSEHTNAITAESIAETTSTIVENIETSDNEKDVFEVASSIETSTDGAIEVTESEENESAESNFADQPLPGAAHRFNEINSVNVNQPLFEPLHTTDYFASVGIKINEQVLPSDRLGIQLRSFTDWLKTMKKLHGGQIPAENTANAEENVQHLAEISNTKEEVVTEAMAEVLLQQGKKNKAIEVYRKLSLLNPTKIAYFAAKIDQLLADDIA